MQTPAQTLAAALNVTEIDAARSSLHAGLRHAEIQRQADLLDKLAAVTGFDIESALAQVSEDA